MRIFAMDKKLSAFEKKEANWAFVQSGSTEVGFEPFILMPYPLIQIFLRNFLKNFSTTFSILVFSSVASSRRQESANPFKNL